MPASSRWTRRWRWSTCRGWGIAIPPALRRPAAAGGHRPRPGVQAAPDAAGRALLQHRHPGADEADPRDPRPAQTAGLAPSSSATARKRFFAFADRLALCFCAGRIEQVGQLEHISPPGNRFVAGFSAGQLSGGRWWTATACRPPGTICGQEPHGWAVGSSCN